MNLLAAALYLASAISVAGMLWRCLVWWRTPVPLRIPLTPAPGTSSGAAWRVIGEAVTFRSLRRADPFLWAVSWIFHAALLLIAAGHVGGLVVPALMHRILGAGWNWSCRTMSALGLAYGNAAAFDEERYQACARVLGGTVAIAALIGVIALLVRRVALPRLRFVSTPGDYIALLLVLLVLVTGIDLRLRSGAANAPGHEFITSVLRLHPTAAPSDVRFTVHLLLVCALMVYLPFSKLVHLGGIFFSPTLNQPNDARTRRYVGATTAFRPKPAPATASARP